MDKHKDMKMAFTSGNKTSAMAVEKYLTHAGFITQSHTAANNFVIDVAWGQYINALKKGTDFILANQPALKDVCWVNAYDERQTNSNGAWPVAYGVFGKNSPISYEKIESGEILDPALWTEYDPKYPQTKEYAEQTPELILEMFKDLRVETGGKILTRYTQRGLEFKCACDHGEFRETRNKVGSYLLHKRIFSTIYLLTIDGYIIPGSHRELAMPRKSAVKATAPCELAIG